MAGKREGKDTDACGLVLSRKDKARLRVRAVHFWRIRKADEAPEERTAALRFERAWRKTYRRRSGYSVFDVARLIGSDVAEHAAREEARATIVVAAQVRRLLERLRVDLQRAMTKHIPGTSHPLAVFVERAARLRAMTPTARRMAGAEPRVSDERSPFGPPRTLEELGQSLDAFVANLLAHSPPLCVQAELEPMVRHRGTKRKDREFNRMAAELEHWMRERGGVDHAVAVQFFEFFGFDNLTKPGDPKLPAERLRIQADRLRKCAARYRREHAPRASGRRRRTA